MYSTGSCRKVFCNWTAVLRSMPFSYGNPSEMVGGQCKHEKASGVRVMLGGIEPLAVVVCLVTVLVGVHFLPYVWYFIKFCFRTIKYSNTEESPQCRQGREDIPEELHEDLSQQLQHRVNPVEYMQDADAELMGEQPLYQYPNRVDSCIQVHPRNFPLRRRVSHHSLRHAYSRVATPQRSCTCLHRQHTSMREPECTWPSSFACHRASTSCTWIRYPPYAAHQTPGVAPTPRLTRYPLEVASSIYYKDEPTQTTHDDFVEALQKCRMVRQTRSGAVYSVYF